MKFGLQPHLDMLMAEQKSTPPTTPAEFSVWQMDQIKSLARLLGLEDRPFAPEHAVQMSAVDCGSYIEEKYSLEVGEGVETPIYLLIPKTEPPHTPILTFHGHDPSVQYILGHYPDEETADYNQKTDNNYAQALAQAGYLICAVEQRGMGERLTGQTGDDISRSCRHLAFSYLMLGRTLLGERCWDGMCAINYLQTRADIRPGILGCTGHSGGGTTALFLAVLDERITTVVISGYFCSLQASILGIVHCECNYVPGILPLGEMGDIAALIAPRPLCLVNGRNDPIFPIHGALEQFETVKQTYETYGRPEACNLAIHPGQHVYHLPTSLEWFESWCLEKETG